MQPTTIRRLADAPAVSEALARAVVDVAREAIDTRGGFAIALAGGETPRAAYERLGRLVGGMDWTRVHVFFTDERFVPPEDPRNNAAMAIGAWLSRVSIPRRQVHAIPTEGGTPTECAERYEHTLREWLPVDEATTFDLAIMGIGVDGHTASLFPDDPASLSERDRWVLAVEAPPGTHPRDRITLTLPILNRSRRVVFAASGAAKRDRVAEVLGGQSNLPAALVHGVEATEWLVDAAAY